eukprot:3548384-Pyramimonas_sp.AAC.1
MLTVREGPCTLSGGPVLFPEVQPAYLMGHPDYAVGGPAYLRGTPLPFLGCTVNCMGGPSFAVVMFTCWGASLLVGKSRVLFGSPVYSLG